MNNQSNIYFDDQFKRKLDSIKVKAPDDAFGHILDGLNAKKKKRFAALWLTGIKVAAGLALFFSTSYFVWRTVNNNQQEKPILAKEQHQHNDTKTNANPAEKQIPNEKTSSTLAYNGQVESDFNTDPLHGAMKASRNDNAIFSQKKESIRKMVPIAFNIESTKAEMPKRLALDSDEEFEIQILNNLAAIKENEEMLAHNPSLSLGGGGGPGYSYRFAKASNESTSPMLLNNNNLLRENKASEETGNVTAFGGITARYKVLKRFSIESGMYLSSVKSEGEGTVQSINGSYAREQADYFGSIAQTGYTSGNSTGNFVVHEQAFPSTEVEKDFSNNAGNLFSYGNYTIRQEFSYLEIPLIANYFLMDKKVDISVRGGLGMSFLIDNDLIFDHQNGGQQEVGYTELNKRNVNGIFGFGINYPLFSGFHLSLEPTVRYQLNNANINNSRESYPYLIGVLTGVYYRF